ncbi:MAG: hypothetical protein PVJ57_22355 [Phycisphaerae bacterium]|jgi:hypothetical protein
MKRLALITATLATMSLAATSFASDADTSASATNARRGSAGTATATAHYTGTVGFARTDTRSGSTNLARGVAVGFDRDGLSLSVSEAIAPRLGPAVATNFNLSIGRNGEVSGSMGRVVATGSGERSVTAGGGSGAGRLATPSVSYATGRTGATGNVTATTRAYNAAPARVVPIRRTHPVGPVRRSRIR